MTPLLILGPSTPEMDRVEVWAKTNRVRYTFTYTVRGSRACIGQLEWGFFYPGEDWEYFPETFAHIRVGCDVPCPNGVEVINVEARVQDVQDAVVGAHSRSIRKAAINMMGG